MSIEERPEMAEEVNATVDTAVEDSSTVSEVEESKKVEAKAEAAKKPLSFMEQALQGMVEIRVGKVLDCKVMEKREDGLVVYCGQKKDGFVSIEEVGDEKPFDEINVGDTFRAKLIENKTSNKEFLTLSKKLVDAEKLAKAQKEEAEKEILAGDFDVVITKVVTGGLLASKADYTVFIPNSQIDVNPVDDEAKANLVGQTVKVRKLPEKKDEKNNGRKKIVASRRQVIQSAKKAEAIARRKAREEKIQAEEQKKKDIFNANIDRFQVNHIVPGVVRKFVSFGAFVEVYGFLCLAPTNEISWIRDTAANEVLKINTEYEFLITKVDPENFKVTLSYKQLQKKPYEIAAEKYPVGSVVKGTVQSIVKFGAFVSIEPGIDGLVHISNIAYEKVEDVESVLQVGQEIEAKVISFEGSRIALSIKDLQEAPQTEKREHRSPKAKGDKPAGEKKARREEAYESPEERVAIETYGGASDASNHALADMLKGFKADDSDDNN